MDIYLDNSATSWPKPESVTSSICNYLNNFGGSPGRSGHHFAVQAARVVTKTREAIAGFFNVPFPGHVMFSANATHALNFAIKGTVNKGDHVIITHMEHNAVYRTVFYLKSQGLIDFDIAPCNTSGYLDIDHLQSLIRPNTRMIICIHGSNVTGTIQDIAKIGGLCHQRNILFLVDAAQSAGFVPIDMVRDNIDLLAFTGHKKLYGPPGIGGLCIRGNIEVRTHIHGGTGSHSEDAEHPVDYPDRLEAGTINTVGILGLQGGLSYVINKGIDHIRQSLMKQTRYFMDECQKMNAISLYGPDIDTIRLPLVSMNISGLAPGDAAARLDKEFGIMVRAGLHCSPLAHQTIGTFPQGTLRFSFGCFTTEDELQQAIDALKKICR